MKHALVRPLLKKRNLHTALQQNYRPVSNFSLMSRLIEKRVCNQRKKNLLVEKLYAKCKCACRVGHSMETAILRVHNDVMCSLDKRRGANPIMLDMSATFYIVNHDILVHRLHI